MSRLSIDDLRVVYPGRREPAIRGLSVEVESGQSLGVVGESGCGKTTLARAILRLLPDGSAVSGAIHAAGRELLGLSEPEMRQIRGKAVGLVPQGSMNSLNPVLSVGDQIAEPLRVHKGEKKRPAREHAIALLESVELEADVVRRYPHELSGGMRQRAVIAIALAASPQLLVADEPTTGLDVVTQRQILELLGRLRARLGLTLLLISHDLNAVLTNCDTVVVMYAGRAVERAPAGCVAGRPRHPYTAALLTALPSLYPADQPWQTIPGAVPDPAQLPAGCAFHPRCPNAVGACATAAPERYERADGWVECHLFADPLREATARPVFDAAIRAVGPPAERRGERAGEGWASLPSAATVNRAAPLLAVTNVSVTFGSRAGARAVQALTEVSLTVARGTAVGLVGQTGSGKSTLGRCILGLIRPTGSIVFDGREVTTLHRRDLSAYRRRVSIIQQDPYGSLHPAMSVRSIVAEPLVAATRHARSARDAGTAGASGIARAGRVVLDSRITEALEAAGLPATEEILSSFPRQLSGGQRQRVAIARALIRQPEMIVADEPTSMLDVSIRASILRTLQGLQAERGLSLILITHDLAEVAHLCATVNVMFEGRIVESGPTAEVIARPRHPHTQALVQAASAGPTRTIA